jgi:hypothetical protein
MPPGMYEETPPAREAVAEGVRNAPGVNASATGESCELAVADAGSLRKTSSPLWEWSVKRRKRLGNRYSRPIGDDSLGRDWSISGDAQLESRLCAG